MSTTAPPIEGAETGAAPPLPDDAPWRWDASTVAQRTKMLRALPPLAQPLLTGVNDLATGGGLSRCGWSALPAFVRALLRVSFHPEGEISKPDRIALADLLEVHQGYLYQCLTGRGDMDAAAASRAERLTGLRRWRLRQSDWREVWPELVDLPGAPRPPEDAPAEGSGRAAAAA